MQIEYPDWVTKMEHTLKHLVQTDVLCNLIVRIFPPDFPRTLTYCILQRGSVRKGEHLEMTDLPLELLPQCIVKYNITRERLTGALVRAVWAGEDEYAKEEAYFEQAKTREGRERSLWYYHDLIKKTKDDYDHGRIEFGSYIMQLELIKICIRQLDA